MRVALLMDYYRRLPERRPGEDGKSWAVRLHDGLARFQQEVSARYTEGTLQRLLYQPNAEARQAAITALGLVGTLASNKLLSSRLHDKNATVRQLAHDAMWSLWFRGDAPEHCRELQKLMRQRDPQRALTGINALIQKAPSFAEAYNQRAIVYFRIEDYAKSISDCETTLKLNPLHFGAASGMAQCYMKLKKPRSALKAFRNAFRLNPHIEGIEDTIRTLEDVLGEEGRKEDK